LTLQGNYFEPIDQIEIRPRRDRSGHAFPPIPSNFALNRMNVTVIATALGISLAMNADNPILIEPGKQLLQSLTI
jgi:hypothetical protein